MARMQLRTLQNSNLEELDGSWASSKVGCELLHHSREFAGYSGHDLADKLQQD